MEGFCSEISRNEINIGSKIGKGMRGVVYSGRCRGYDVAIKVIQGKLLDPMNGIKSEINIMSQLRFPNVCLFLGACIEPDFFYIVQEFLPGGDLRSLSNKEKLPTSFYARMRLANQAARGMIWIHSAGILHRDLKLENLLLDKHGEVKVCDFGLSDTIGTQQSIENNKMKGSPLYMAPEVLLGKVMKKKVDVYSFGILLWELLAKQRAFEEHLQHNDIQKFADAICVKKERPPIPPPETTEVAWNKKELVTLLQRCWHDDPDQRPDFEEIYDKLNYFIAGSIEDSWGQNFWLLNFPDQYKVTWNEFIEALSSSKTVQMPDGSQLHKGLAIKLLPKHIWESLKILLGQISGSKNLTDVTVESFGKLLEWFGPGITVKESQQYSFLENMTELCSYSWFHGSIPSTRAQELLRSYNEKSFLVRLSSVPGSFVVQTRTTCVRITHKPGEGFLPEGGVTHATLPQLVESTMTSSKYTPCPGSALAELLPNHQSQNQDITPYKDMGAIVVLNGNPNQVPDKARAVVAYQLQKEERQTLERERSKKERTVEEKE